MSKDSRSAYGVASRYGARLLDSLEAGVPPEATASAEHPAIACARSGLMALTGSPAGQPVLIPAPLAACAHGALLALRALAPGRLPPDIDGAALLGERAAVARLRRRGSISPGGACRILPTATTPIAINVARPDDWRLVAAWLEDAGWKEGPEAAMWESLAPALIRHDAAALVERGRLIGLPVARAALPTPAEPNWFRLSGRAFGDVGNRRDCNPLVVDLSCLWAGPLCGHLLGLLGARVIKVESLARPDGARRGAPALFDLMNAGKESVALDFESPRGRAQLLELVSRADIVIEASRPRALRQLGVQAEEVLRIRPGATWISISGYGRQEPEAGWTAYGDDAGVAAGLTSLLNEVTGEWLICGDAVADPLTGLHAALVAWQSFLSGGGRLISLSLCQVAAHAAGFELPQSIAARRARHAEWREVLQSSLEPVAAPRARSRVSRACDLGADTHAVVSEFALPPRLSCADACSPRSSSS
jgi:crotonobetainyl-CoA:carnitine CoA-transferase CaiB-like acyl-CoA transferase